MLSYLRGDDLVDESRSIAPPTTKPGLLPWSTTAPLDVNESNALSVADAYAAIRVLADSIASLPPKVYRRTPAGRVPAGPDSRLVQLLQTPSPGSTSADLFSQVAVHLNVNGNAFIGKFRGGDGSIVQIGLLNPTLVEVELRGQTVVYTITLNGRRSEHGPADVLHIKGMSSDGLRGMSPVTQCRVALGLSSSLQQSAKSFTESGSRPSGILTAANANSDAVELHPRRPLGRRQPIPRTARAERQGGRAHLPGARVGDRRPDRRQPHVLERRAAEPGARRLLAASLAGQDREGGLE